ncbi:hypothetical protein ROZALSC1DRAFT_27910 [Rozella allomycis CSF55]|uniref:Transcription factor CBF/NF-Y/archaeal histone domain-containing protein n=1 Tax=Rozella allomycis (strain CSF55) TaxID=988480 RepID=A0A075B4E9_ROZAC|nr:hypothetical protein O9G_003654 [Rozella allomycis CSF55]RKP20634.1 hypothetical protein ROZALSC1DRAFT_27910 [Rozella allomycis CSF55]|eukprot:EPZ36082.1 hypothetical protein O9G_003654 [Rozella allomycis CSF55]
MKHKKYQTRFPVGRVKRIMQVDEEVGKVSQLSTILVYKSEEIVKSRSGNKLTPSVLKMAVESTEQFDFLKDLVEKVPELKDEDIQGAKKRKRKDATANTKVKEESDQDATDSESEPLTRKSNPKNEKD